MVGINKRQIGDQYENMAARYLEKQGYKILARQYRSRQGEIDLVAQDGRVVVFVEVKGRQNTAFGLPQEAVDRRKQQRLWKVAQHFLWANRLQESLCRFDVVAICGKDPHTSLCHIKHAFCGF